MKNNKITKIIFLFLTLLVSLYYTYEEDIQDFFTKEVRKREVKEVINLEDKDKFKIYFIDVGEADSTLIFSNGEYALVDAGNNRDGEKLVNYFNSLGITNIKYLIATHIHEDHIGGMDNIIRSFNIENYLTTEEENKTRTFTEIGKCLNEKGISSIVPKEGENYPLGDANLEVLSISKDEDDLNDTSIVLRLTYKNTSYLFMADASKNIELKLLDKDIRSDLLKVGHHGSRDSTSAQFLRRVNPEYAVISVGKNNDYGHPHSITLNKLERIDTKVYRTDELGTIIVSSDGTNLFFENLITDTDGNKKD